MSNAANDDKNEFIPDLSWSPERKRFEQVKHRISQLDSGQQHQIQAGIAGFELIMSKLDPWAAHIAVAYVSCALAARIEAAPAEPPRIIIPGELH